jgi:hypothetical protein
MRRGISVVTRNRGADERHYRYAAVVRSRERSERGAQLREPRRIVRHFGISDVCQWYNLRPTGAYRGQIWAKRNAVERSRLCRVK